MFRNAPSCPWQRAVAYVICSLHWAEGAVAATLKANTVGTKQLKNGAVTGQKVAKNTLTGANIQAGTLGTVPNAAKLGGLAPSAYSTITNITAGTDLTGGGGSRHHHAERPDETKVQHRVTGTCTIGSAVIGINQAGTVGCEPVDADDGRQFGNYRVVARPTSPHRDSRRQPEREANAGVVASAVPSTAGSLWVKIATPTPIGGGLPPTLILWTVTLDVNGSASAPDMHGRARRADLH